jgi:hypothetical protein
MKKKFFHKGICLQADCKKQISQKQSEKCWRRQRKLLKDNYPKIEYSGAEFFKDTKAILQQIFGDRYFRKMQVFLTCDATSNRGIICCLKMN